MFTSLRLNATPQSTQSKAQAVEANDDRYDKRLPSCTNAVLRVVLFAARCCITSLRLIATPQDTQSKALGHNIDLFAAAQPTHFLRFPWPLPCLPQSVWTSTLPLCLCMHCDPSHTLLTAVLDKRPPARVVGGHGAERLL